MFIISMYDRVTGIPVRTETVLEWSNEAEETYLQFQEMARDGYGVMVTEEYMSATFVGFEPPKVD